jgi:hypothetical protein
MRLYFAIPLVILFALIAAIVFDRLRPAPITGVTTSERTHGMRAAQEAEDGACHSALMLPPATQPVAPTTKP